MTITQQLKRIIRRLTPAEMAAAKLVAAAEREECAKLCEEYTHGQWLADAIRARGNT